MRQAHCHRAENTTGKAKKPAAARREHDSAWIRLPVAESQASIFDGQSAVHQIIELNRQASCIIRTKTRRTTMLVIWRHYAGNVTRHITAEAMTAGRNPVPTAIKELRNAVQPCRKNANEPQGRPICKKPPSYFSAEEKKIWRSVVSELNNARIITDLDYNPLKQYCVYMAEFDACSKDIRERGRVFITPTGFERPNPNIKIRKGSANTLGRLGSVLGLDPPSRTRLSVPEEQSSSELLA